MEIWLYPYPGGTPEKAEVIQAVAGYWEAIGLDTKITPLHMIAAFGNIMVRKTTGIVGGWTVSAMFEPWGQQFERLSYSKQSFVPIYESYELDELIEKHLAAPGVEEKDRLARQMTQFIYDEYVDVPLVTSDKLFVKNDDTVGDWVTIKWQRNVLNYEYITHPTPLGTFRLFEP